MQESRYIMGGRGGERMGAKVVFAKSDYSEMGKVPLIRNSKIGNNGNYQGHNDLGYNKATSHGTILEARNKIIKQSDKYPKSVNKEAFDKVKQIKSGNQKIKVYRATVGKQINNNDWVFLTEKQADTWARSRFTKKPAKGVSVIEATVPAKNVHWTGKNLEFTVLKD